MPNHSPLPISVEEIELPPSLEIALMNAVKIMARLRALDGCPWDRAQTHDSLCKNLLEETYETLHAIESRDDDALREELGDLLLQVIFHAQIAEQRGAFSLGDVARELTEKLVRRHPHVFGDVAVDGPCEALQAWTTAKRAEGDHTIDLGGVPRTMPALLRARKIADRAARLGFEWPSVEGALGKLDEELGELRRAIDGGDSSEIEGELGDALFIMACIAHYVQVDAELALGGAADKFIRRFAHIRKRLAERGLTPEGSSLEEMDRYWDEAKGEE